MKFKIRKHGKYVDNTIDTQAPIIVCPECGEEIKNAKIDKTWRTALFVTISFFQADTVCPHCGCEFIGEEEIDRKIDWHDLFVIITFLTMASGLITVIASAVISNLLVALIGIALFFGGAIMGMIVADD